VSGDVKQAVDGDDRCQAAEGANEGVEARGGGAATRDSKQLMEAGHLISGIDFFTSQASR
jgi:hypothetical protein